MKPSNHRFMERRCEMCGGSDIANMALSELILKAGYGSQYDGQEMRVTICGKCVDQLIPALEESRQYRFD